MKAKQFDGYEKCFKWVIAHDSLMVVDYMFHFNESNGTWIIKYRTKVFGILSKWKTVNE